MSRRPTLSAVLAFENRFGEQRMLGRVDLTRFDALNLSDELVRRRGSRAAGLPLHSYSVQRFLDQDAAVRDWQSAEWQTTELERLEHMGNFLAPTSLVDFPVKKEPAEVFLDRAAVWQIRPNSDKLTGHLSLELLYAVLVHLSSVDEHPKVFGMIAEPGRSPAFAAGWAAEGIAVAGRTRVFPEGLRPPDLEPLLASERRPVREHAVTALARLRGPSPRRGR